MDYLYAANLLYNVFLYLAAFTGAFLVALWISLIFWTYRDIRTRTRDRVIQIMSTVMVGLLFIPGLFVYFILRPKETLDQIYYKTLEEEALLISIEQRTKCPGCGAQADPAWYYCPLCYTRLGKQCASCEKKLELSWQLCPYCGTAVPGSRAKIKNENEIPLHSQSDDTDDAAFTEDVMGSNSSADVI